MQVLALFGKVWGAGVETTMRWYAQGFRTIEDLKGKHAKLTAQQSIGVKYFEVRHLNYSICLNFL